MFRASLPIVRSFPLYTASKQIQNGLCLEAVIKNLHKTCQCRIYSGKLLMMGKEDARNM